MKKIALLSLYFLQFNTISRADVRPYSTLHEDECYEMGYRDTGMPEWDGCIETMKEHYGELARDGEGKTLLHIAAINGYVEVINFFMNSHEAKNSILLGNKDSLGNTPLHYAVEHGHREVFELLFKSGASVRLKNNQGKSVLDMLFAKSLPAKQNSDIDSEAEYPCVEAIKQSPPNIVTMGDKFVVIDDYILNSSLEADCRDAVMLFVCLNPDNLDLAKIKKEGSLDNMSVDSRDGETYCHIETEPGIFQVILSSMAVNPTAIVLYSHWD